MTAVENFTREEKEAALAISKPPASAAPPPRKKLIYVGAPACFALEMACQTLHRAFCRGGGGIYLVGSALERPDWRDIDLRLILPDDEFKQLFPGTGPVEHSHCEFDPRWMVMTTSISAWLSVQSGLPVDFQFQSRTHANERHKGRRNAMGMIFASEDPEE